MDIEKFKSQIIPILDSITGYDGKIQIIKNGFNKSLASEVDDVSKDDLNHRVTAIFNLSDIVNNLKKII